MRPPAQASRFGAGISQPMHRPPATAIEPWGAIKRTSASKQSRAENEDEWNRPTAGILASHAKLLRSCTSGVEYFSALHA